MYPITETTILILRLILRRLDVQHHPVADVLFEGLLILLLLLLLLLILVHVLGRLLRAAVLWGS